MIKNISGCFPALVTPLFEKGSPIDYPVNHKGMYRLIDYVIAGGVDGIVVSGCTGHSCSLTWDEQLKFIEDSFGHVSDRVKVIAGDGSNSTREAISAAKKIEDLGIEVHLQISPYQNRPTQEGLFQHYAAIAEKIDGDIILYNVPSRTGRNIEPETTIRLANKYSNIIGIKEASGNMTQITRIIDETSDMPFSVLSGDDKLTVDVIKAGGTGIVSVAANIVPDIISDITNLALEGKYDEARKIDETVQKLYAALFIETNPSPAHYILRELGFPVGIPRLTLVDVEPENKEKIKEVLYGMGLLKDA